MAQMFFPVPECSRRKEATENQLNSISSATLGIVRNTKVIYITGFVICCCLFVFDFYVEKHQAQQGEKVEERQVLFMTFLSCVCPQNSLEACYIEAFPLIVLYILHL